MSSFNAYLIGFIVFVIGLGAAAYLLGVAASWIAVGAVVLIGIGIVSAVTRTKQKDLPEKTSS